MAPTPPATTGACSAGSTGDGSGVSVVVRARPFLPREKGQPPAIRVDGNQISIQVGGPAAEWRHFAFDLCLPQDSTQESLYEQVGEPILGNALEGFNGTLFAYGQTGSGKSFSIMGNETDKGVIPRLLYRLFAVVEGDTRPSPANEIRITMSFLEIYNEEINDLLDPRPRAKKLYVHQHPQLGIYVPNLTEAAATGVVDSLRLLDFGAKIRATAQTNMNSTSSRSHSVCTLRLVQVLPGGAIRKSSIHLCDLAGSERAKKTGASGQRMREGASINASLSVLGQVIAKLASGAERKGVHVPFRQSKLTHLLTDALSGNSVTTMLANVSPALSEGEESLSTLRFAESVKKVKTKPKVTELGPEEPKQMLKTLNAEIEMLQNALVAESTMVPKQIEMAIEGAEYLQRTLSAQAGDQWAEAVQKTRDLEAMQQQLLAERCLPLVDVSRLAGVEANAPYLLNVSDDPSLSGCLLYFLQPDPGITSIGRGGPNSIAPNNVVLEGLGIPTRLAEIQYHDAAFEGMGRCLRIVKVSGVNERGRLLVNGRPLECGEANPVGHGTRLVFGWAFCFRLIVPGSSESVPEDVTFANFSTEVLQYSMTTTMGSSDVIKAVSQWSSDLERRGYGIEDRESIMEVVGEIMVSVEEGNALCEEVHRAWPEAAMVNLDVGLSIPFLAVPPPLPHATPKPPKRPVEVVIQVWRLIGREQRLLAAWPAWDFERRLQGLRDAHREVVRGTQEDGARWAWRLAREDWWIAAGLSEAPGNASNAEAIPEGTALPAALAAVATGGSEADEAARTA